jgi:hypothetical protein
MATNIKRQGFDNACIYMNESGQIGMTTGPPGGRGGHLTVTEDGVTRGGTICDENSMIFRPGTMTMPFPLSMLPSVASAPQEIFVPPFMDLLPMLGPVVAASAAVVALGAIAKASRG